MIPLRQGGHMDRYYSPVETRYTVKTEACVDCEKMRYQDEVDACRFCEDIVCQLCHENHFCNVEYKKWKMRKYA